MDSNESQQHPRHECGTQGIVLRPKITHDNLVIPFLRSSMLRLRGDDDGALAQQQTPKIDWPRSIVEPTDTVPAATTTSSYSRDHFLLISKTSSTQHYDSTELLRRGCCRFIAGLDSKRNQGVAYSALGAAQSNDL